MGIKVQIDQGASQCPASSTSGLVLGTESPQPRILYLVPTPPTPPGTSSHRWAVEHANLVQPMCPGGLLILGTYLSLRGSSASPAKDVDSAAAIARDISAQHRNRQMSFLLCRGPKGRTVVKQVGPESGDSLKTCDLKEVPTLADSVLSIQANVPFPKTLFPSPSNYSTPAEFKSSFSSFSDKLVATSILQLPDDFNTIVTSSEDTRNLAEVVKSTSDKIKSGKDFSLCQESIRAQLLTPISLDCDQADNSIEIQKGGETPYKSVDGNMHLEAVAMVDGTVGDVLKALNVDLVRSLRSRVDLLVESCMVNAGDTDDTQEQWDLQNLSVLPARVVASSATTKLRFLSVTEYLMPEETIDEDLTSRFLEAFSWDEKMLEDFRVEQKEKHNATFGAKENIPSSETSQTEVASRQAASANSEFDAENLLRNSVLLALLLAILAIVVKPLLDYW